MKLLRYVFFPIPHNSGSNGHLGPIDTDNGDLNCLVCSVFSFGSYGCFFPVGNFFDNRLIKIIQSIDTNLKGFIKFNLIRSFELPIYVCIRTSAYSGSDNYGDTTCEQPDTEQGKQHFYFFGHILPFFPRLSVWSFQSPEQVKNASGMTLGPSSAEPQTLKTVIGDINESLLDPEVRVSKPQSDYPFHALPWSGIGMKTKLPSGYLHGPKSRHPWG